MLGALILLATMTAIHQHRIGVREANLFRLLNDLALPGWTRWPIWGVMQLGVIGAVPLVAGLALVTRRIRLALYAALASGTIYLVAKLVKQFVQRGRPQTLLADVYIFDIPDRGLGYVSGHSAVAVALATVASLFLGRRARRVAWTLAGLVCVARIYVGSHLPLDVVGGVALGWAAGALVLMVFGAPTGHPSLARVRDALERYGFDPADLARSRARVAVRLATWSPATPTRSCSSRWSPASGGVAGAVLWQRRRPAGPAAGARRLRAPARGLRSLAC